MEQQWVDNITRELDELKATDIKMYHVGEKSPIADYFILASVDNMPQLEACKNRIEDLMNRHNIHLRNSHEQWKGGWLLMDFNNIIVNVFLEERRQFYNPDALMETGNFDLEEIKDVRFNGKK